MKKHSIPRNLTSVSIGIFLSVVFFSVEVLASSRVVGLDELLEHSELVISGSVVQKSMYREQTLIDTISSDGKGGVIKKVETIDAVLTDYEIEVLSVIEGAYDKPTIVLTSHGGTAGDQTISFSLSFRPTIGTKYILFLTYEKRNDKWWVIAGRRGALEEVVAGSNIFRTVSGERFTVEQLKARIQASTHD